MTDTVSEPIGIRYRIALIVWMVVSMMPTYVLVWWSSEACESPGSECGIALLSILSGGIIGAVVFIVGAVAIVRLEGE